MVKVNVQAKAMDKANVQVKLWPGSGSRLWPGSGSSVAKVRVKAVARVRVKAVARVRVKAVAKTKAVTKLVDDHSIASWSRGYVYVTLQQGIVSGY